MAWLILLIAGLLETVWAVGLKYTEGFTKLWISAGVVVAIIASMGLLGVALRDLPVSTGYPVWVGIGILGTTIWGIFVLGEGVNIVKLLFLTLLFVGIIGLKLSSD